MWILAEEHTKQWEQQRQMLPGETACNDELSSLSMDGICQPVLICQDGRTQEEHLTEGFNSWAGHLY